MNLRYRMFFILAAIGLMAPLAIFGRQQTADKASAMSAAEDVQRISVADLKDKLTSSEAVVIIDVRGKDFDSSDSKIKGAIRIAPTDIESHIADLSRDSQIVTYCSCATDGGAVSAARVLKLNGFKNVRALRGGWNAWLKAGGATEPK